MSSSVPSIAYGDFVSADQTLQDHGGPWTPQSLETPGAEVELVQGSPCSSPFCLCCYVDDAEGAITFHTSYVANVSVDMARYGNSNALQFTWSFWPAFLKSGPIAGVSYPVKSQIGDAAYTDTISATDYTAFHVPGGAWDAANKISHNGTMTVVPSSGSTAYLLLNISFALNHSNRTETLGLYVQDINFKISTPALDSTEGTTATSPSFKEAPIGAIVGGTVGGVALLALIIFGILWFRKREKQVTPHSEKVPIDSNGATAVPPVTPAAETPAAWQIPAAAGVQYDFANGSASPPSSPSPPWTTPATPGSQGEQPLLAAAAPLNRSPTYVSSASMSNRPMSAASSYAPRHGSPPVYGSSVYAYGASSNPLSTWANSNRAFITEDLESKLATAGYLPTDNPDDLTEEEWTNQFGLTKLEVLRLRKLYSGSHPMVEAPAQVDKTRA